MPPPALGRSVAGMLTDAEWTAWSAVAVRDARATEAQRRLCSQHALERWRFVPDAGREEWKCAWCGRLSLERAGECWPLVADLPEVG